MATPMAWEIGPFYMAQGVTISIAYMFGNGVRLGAQFAIGTPLSTFSVNDPTVMEAVGNGLSHNWVLDSDGYVQDQWVYFTTIANRSDHDTWYLLTGGGTF